MLHLRKFSQPISGSKWFKSGEENATIEFFFFLIILIDFIETAIFSLAFAVIAILSNFSWALPSPQEKLKTMVMQKFGGILGNFGWFSEILAFEATLKFEYKKIQVCLFVYHGRCKNVE